MKMRGTEVAGAGQLTQLHRLADLLKLSARLGDSVVQAGWREASFASPESRLFGRFDRGEESDVFSSRLSGEATYATVNPGGRHSIVK